MLRSRLVALAMAGGIGLAALTCGPAAAASLSCGDVITADVVLDQDLLCAGTALVVDVAAPATVRIDLNGHRLIGNGTGRGIEVAFAVDPGSLIVSHGTIAGFDSAVAGTGAAYIPILRNLTLESLTVRSTARWLTTSVTGDVLVAGSRFVDAGLGGAATDGGSLTVLGSTFRRSGIKSASESVSVVRDSTFVGGGFANGPASTLSIERSRFSSCDVAILAWADWYDLSVVRDNVIHGCATGISLIGNGPVTVSGNRVDSGSGNGITFSRSTSSNPVLIDGNTVTRNAGDGISGLGTAAVVIGGNDASRNGGHGISVTGVTDGGGNTARRNGLEPQCAGVVCTSR